jgi:hypothetical protein
MARPRDHVLTFAGAGVMYVSQKGRHVRVLEAPTAAVFIEVEDAAEVKVAAGQGINDQDGFKKLTVRSTVAQTVRLRVSETLQEDNSTNVQVNATATVQGATVITAVPLVEVPALSTVQLAAGDPDRVELRVALASDEPGPVWLGPAGVGADEGGLLEPGMIDYPATTAAVFAHNPHATLSVWVSVLDMTAP